MLYTEKLCLYYVVVLKRAIMGNKQPKGASHQNSSLANYGEAENSPGAEHVEDDTITNYSDNTEQGSDTGDDREHNPETGDGDNWEQNLETQDEASNPDTNGGDDGDENPKTEDTGQNPKTEDTGQNHKTEDTGQNHKTEDSDDADKNSITDCEEQPSKLEDSQSRTENADQNSLTKNDNVGHNPIVAVNGGVNEGTGSGDGKYKPEAKDGVDDKEQNRKRRDEKSSPKTEDCDEKSQDPKPEDSDSEKTIPQSGFICIFEDYSSGEYIYKLHSDSKDPSTSLVDIQQNGHPHAVMLHASYRHDVKTATCLAKKVLLDVRGMEEIPNSSGWFADPRKQGGKKIMYSVRIATELFNYNMISKELLRDLTP